MEITEKRTNNLLLKAYSDSEWDQVDFAILKITGEYLHQLKKIYDAMLTLPDLQWIGDLSLWIGDVSFHSNSDETIPFEILEEIEQESPGYSYIRELNRSKLPEPEQQLSGYETVLDKYGNLYLRAGAKHTGERYWTNSFNIYSLLGNDSGEDEMKQQVDICAKLTFEADASLDNEYIFHKLKQHILDSMILLNHRNEYSFVECNFISTRAEADIYDTENLYRTRYFAFGTILVDMLEQKDMEGAKLALLQGDGDIYKFEGDLDSLIDSANGWNYYIELSKHQYEELSGL
ncbi:hypothetical protein [Olivibacter jilunii]|uniref:hypothetical protein n=1 Tax=Olivibacter jilunii TaxID=985016 RepID=UPI001032151B|nr:hypothetical protein [Olivibacter jilunii]